MVTQMIEMVSFTEKLRVIGRERIDEAFELALMRRKIFAVVAECIQSQRAQPACEVAIDHFAFAILQHDPGMFVGKPRQAPEIHIGERKFAHTVDNDDLC